MRMTMKFYRRPTTQLATAAPSRALHAYACVRLRSHRHQCEYESESRFPFTRLSLVQALLARLERSRSLVQAHTQHVDNLQWN